MINSRTWPSRTLPVGSITVVFARQWGCWTSTTSISEKDTKEKMPTASGSAAGVTSVNTVSRNRPVKMTDRKWFGNPLEKVRQKRPKMILQ